MARDYKTLEDYAASEFEKSGLSQIGGWDYHRIQNMKYAINIHNYDHSVSFECWTKGAISSAVKKIIQEKLDNKEIIEFNHHRDEFKIITDPANPNDNWGKSSYATIDGIQYQYPFNYGNQIPAHKYAYRIEVIEYIIERNYGQIPY
jgi:hypothetical protein